MIDARRNLAGAGYQSRRRDKTAANVSHTDLRSGWLTAKSQPALHASDPARRLETSVRTNLPWPPRRANGISSRHRCGISGEPKRRQLELHRRFSPAARRTGAGRPNRLATEGLRVEPNLTVARYATKWLALIPLVKSAARSASTATIWRTTCFRRSARPC